MRWLAQRDHSRAELRRKLLPFAGEEIPTGPEGGVQARGLTGPAGVEAVLDWLEAQRYLSDARFLESRVHVRSPRFGNLRIRHELQQHGLAPDGELMRQLQSSEPQRACEVRARKFEHPAGTAAERAKQARFLAGRGFSAAAIRIAMRTAGTRAADTDEFEDPDATLS